MQHPHWQMTSSLELNIACAHCESVESIDFYIVNGNYGEGLFDVLP